jgi:hypothetical protein
MSALIILTLAVGLLLDHHWVKYGQDVVSAVVWVVCFGLWVRSDPRARPALLACLIFATIGEVSLSLVWGLYEYRLHNIPLFVPPGHVLLFFLGMQLAPRLPEHGEWWVALLALPVVMVFAWNGRDTLGPVLYGFFILCLLLSPSRRLYATMFVLSLVLELYGTWIGNWVWKPEVPGLGLTTLNPPVAAGAFYCVLDFLVVSAVTRLQPALPAEARS